MKMKIPVFLLLIFALVVNVNAQYLKVSRSATIKQEPHRDAQILEKVSKDQLLCLLDKGEQKNGYYKVYTTTHQDSGWIYRTLARRYDGTVPELECTKNISAEDVSNTDILWNAKIPDGYYDGTEDLTGDELKRKLNEIIKDHKEFKYSDTKTDVWDILKETDRDPNNPNNVILIYSGLSTNAEQEYNNGKGWEREHVWSQSHGQFGRSKGPGVDVHHLRPILREFNGFNGKSNKDFDDVGKEFIYKDDLTGCLISDSTWAPIDKVKGDVARMMFYMAVRYEGNDGYPDLELVDYTNTGEINDDEPVYGKLSTLLEWHQKDPVDNWERRRNDIIYEKYQKNRNPFIDHPEFVQLIWSLN